ncbi:hypothetical protein [Bacillus sp. WP8]|uniref:hypothetical protein n=1 Tax=Bacillus sp. WP8 TaxID=756828 RepID=UPI0016424509|nr:hypothetical protein [Bacillus sp. WP8]
MVEEKMKEEEMKERGEEMKEVVGGTDEKKQVMKKGLITYREERVYGVKEECDREW